MATTNLRAGRFVESENDPRTDKPRQGAEKEMLIGFLRWQRETLELKCSGMDAEQLTRRAVEPSTMSLLGLIRHLADVERSWFRRYMDGQDVPHHFLTRDNPDANFDGAVADPEVVDEAWRLWREEIMFADQYVADTDLDLLGGRPDDKHDQRSLRWVLLHMIEEYARHLGHADLLRERIDGRIGM